MAANNNKDVTIEQLKDHIVSIVQSGSYDSAY